MTLIDEYTEVSWQRRNVTYYKELGYHYTSMGDAFKIKTKHLTKGSHVVVRTQCDICKEIVPKPFKNYIKQTKGMTELNTCVKCKTVKLESTLMSSHGVKNPMHVDEYSQKQRNTTFKNHGVYSPQQCDKIKEKTVKTNTKKYGGVSPASCEKVRERMRETNTERYGTPFYSQTEEFKIKNKLTVSEKYGYDYISQVPEIKKKKAKTMHDNGTAPSSTQQRHICELLNGVLNFPEGRCSLDIAFTEEKIYLEYDGGGHNLGVKLGNMSEKEFFRQEQRRYFFLRDRGWKETRIVCESDKLAPDSDIVLFTDIAKELLTLEESKYFSIIWNMDTQTVKLNHKRKFSFSEFISGSTPPQEKEVR